jgi:hypothetical protein
MAENDVTIQINLDAKDAQAAIELFGRESTKVLKNTEDQSSSFFNAFKGGALKLAGTFVAITGGFEAIRTGINEAVQDAKLTRQIEASLLAIGDASAGTVQEILDFADAVKDATGVSDDLVKSTFITAQNFGISTDKAKDLTKAAIDLAAATGTDVDSAVRLLGGTFDGTVGKLANYGQEFRNLTKEQLQAGDAIDLVNQKFGGTAIKDLDTYSGRLGQLSNSFGDLLKELGKTITESPTLQALFKLTSFAIDNVTESVKKQREESEKSYATDGLAIAYFGAYSGLAQAAASAQNDLNKEIAAFRDINIGDQSKKVADGFAGIVEQSQGATKATSNFLERLNSIPQSPATKAIGLTGKALEDAKKKAEETAKAFAAFQNSIVQDRGTAKEKIVQKATEDLKKLAEFEKTLGKNSAAEIQRLKIEISKNTNDQLLQLQKDASQKEYDERLAAAKKLSDDLRDEERKRAEAFQAAFANPVKSTLGKLFSSEQISFEDTAGALAGGLNQALQGQQGAKQVVSQLAGVAADAFLPGIGGAVTQITSLLAQGPDEVKKVITEFIKYVPEFIVAIAEAIPAVVDALIDTLLFKGGLEKIIGALLRAIPKIALGLAEAFNMAVVNGANAIGNAIGTFFADALDSIFEPIQGLFDPLTDALVTVRDAVLQLYQPLFDLIDALSGDQAGDFFASLDPTSWFSKGGMVYAQNGFFQPRGTDTVPAMLTPGELVVPRDMVGELGAFLMRQNSGTAGSDSAMLASILSTVQSPIVVRTEAKVNQQAFADIILQLNRQNARLSA